MANANPMTEHFQRYAKRRFLVIDDFAEFRMAVKKMLEEFGAKQIDLASNAEDAFALYSEHRHDVVISDFNLGDGKDGQQLLEELSQLGILRHDTLYLMASAENSLHMVMGALECQPDDYLTKPFTKNTLHTRIDRLLAKKQLLTPLLKALDEKKYPLAEQLALRLQETEPKARAACLKYLADIYMAQQQWPKARRIFATAAEARPLLWAKLGLAECMLIEDGSKPALAYIEDIVQENPRAVSGWDLKAKALVAAGNYPDAQEALQQAINLSPRSLDRLRMAASIAEKNSDIDSQLRYLRLLTKLAKTSALKSPDDFIRHQTALLHKLKTTQGLARKKLASELLTTLKDDQKLYPSSVFMQWSVTATRAQLALAEDKMAAAKEIFARLKHELLPSLDCLQEPGLLGQLLEISQALNDTESAVLISKQLENSHTLDEGRCTDNQLAMKLYKQGEFKEATRYFSVARQQYPNSITIAINLAQGLLKLAESQPLSPVEMQTCKNCLSLGRRLPETDPRYPRVQQLVQRFAALRESP